MAGCGGIGKRLRAPPSTLVQSCAALQAVPRSLACSGIAGRGGGAVHGHELNVRVAFGGVPSPFTEIDVRSDSTNSPSEVLHLFLSPGGVALWGVRQWWPL